MVEIRQIQADESLLLKEVRLAALEDSPDAFATKLEQALVAASLLNKIFEWAAGRGAASILAGVMPANSRALAFYTKLGFTQVSDPNSDHPAVTECELVLEKKLEDKM